MMSRKEFSEHLSALRLSFSEVAQFLGVSERSARRWAEDDSVPGPVEAALRAWLRLDTRHLPWKPDSVSIFHDDQEQIQRMREHDKLLDALMSEVEARGGPSTIWSVDLAKQRATFGPAEVSFHKLQNGGFSPSTYRRVDRAPVDEDRVEIQDACYCIAQAFARARAAKRALIAIADYIHKHAATFVQKGPGMLAPDERDRRVATINMLADDLNVLASSALEGNVLYSEFEAILDALHRLGFFPEQGPVSAVARSMIGPAPPPDMQAESPV
jgi:hypothetical protein